MIKILFVCMGNICRSPMAQGAFTKLIQQKGLEDRVFIDSAGTLDIHQGKPPDQRAILAAKNNDVDISHQRSRGVHERDFDIFDHIIVMDRKNLDDIKSLAGENLFKVSLFLSYAVHIPFDEMADPYRGHQQDFETCYRASIDASAGLLDAILSSK